MRILARRAGSLETRLFALRAAGRKHDVDPDQLAGLRKRLRLQLDEIEDSDGALAATLEAEAKARAAYDGVTARLTAKREASAKMPGGRSPR